MSNSPLVSYTKLSPNHSGKRKHSIDRISPHCIVAQWSVDNIGNWFAKKSTQASCNYGIAKDGKVALIVDEGNRSWCTSSGENDNRAVTIECASDSTHPYAFNNTVYNKLIDLCADICKRNGKNKLIWISDKNKALSYNPKSNEMLLTVHRWFKNKACPGDWLMKRMDDLTKKVNKKLSSSSDTTSSKSTKKSYKVKPTTDNLNIRKGPGTNYNKVGKLSMDKTYTIVEESSGSGASKWGKLESGKGWVSLNFVTKV